MGEKLMAEWFWTDRWMGSSAFLLPIDARGLYREMLSQAWLRGAKLPADFDAIRRAIAVSKKEWDKSWPLVEKYWREEGGFLVNDTQVEVYNSAVTRRDRKVNGGKARAKSPRTGGRFAPATPPATPPAETPAEAPAASQQRDQPPSPSPSLTDIPKTEPTSPYLAREAKTAEPPRRVDDAELAEAQAALTEALTTARQRRPGLAGLPDQAILDRAEYHAPSGRVRMDSTNAKLLHATAGKLRATKPRKASAPAWDRPDTSEAQVDAQAAEWIEGHWPEDCDPASREDLRSLLECLNPPEDMAGRIEVQLRFTRYPSLYLAPAPDEPAATWIAAHWPNATPTANRDDLASELKRRGCPADLRPAVIRALTPEPHDAAA